MAASDYFLKLDKIEGESGDAAHKNEIQVESFSWGVSQAGSFDAGGGGGSGRASFQDFHFVMKVSKASPKLMLACATGDHIGSAKLTCRKAGGEQHEYLTITMTDIMVTSFQTGGSGGSDVIPMEQISLGYSKVEFEYKDQKADGTPGSPIKTGYDLKANKKI
jgi:type VI secretion system secreted protein Hcp